MNKTFIKGELQLEKDLCERLNTLLSIEDFDENPELLDELGFETDSCVYKNSIEVDGYYLDIYVYTGQMNAWVDFSVTDIYGVCHEAQPSFEELTGVYTLDTEKFIADLYISAKNHL